VKRRALLCCVALVAMIAAACSHGSDPKATEGRFYLPGYIPPGMKIVKGSIQQVGPEHAAFGAAMGRAADTRTFTDVVLVLVANATADRAVSPIEHNSTVDINGVAARFHDEALRGSYVDWFQNGMSVAVSGPAGAGATLQAVARSLTLPPDGNLANAALAAPPAGYTVIQSGHFTDRDPEAGETVQVGEAPGPSFRLEGIVTDAPLIVALGGGDRVQATTVRGHAAFTSYRARDIGNGGGKVIEGVIGWYEQPGILLTVVSNSDPERLRPIAEGVRNVTEDQFRHQIPTPTTSTTS
jgi:hypothetical protein